MFQSEQEAHHAAVPAVWRSFAQKKAIMKENFNEYLLDTLSKADYDSLATMLNLSKNKLTRCLKAPSLFTSEDILILCEVLEHDKTPLALITDFDVGIDRVSVRDLRSLQVAL